MYTPIPINKTNKQTNKQTNKHAQTEISNKKVRNSQRYKNFPIPSTRSVNVPITEVEASPLHDYKSYPMPDYLWSKLIRVYQESRRNTSGKTKCFEIIPSTAEEISLFPTGLDNDALRKYLLQKPNCTTQFGGGFDYRERHIQSLPIPGASMYEPLLCYSPKQLPTLSVSKIFTKDTIEALNQVYHDRFLYVHF